MVAGYALVVLACISIVFVQPSWGYFALLPAMVLIGIGASISISASGTVAVSTVVPERAGVAGGLSFMVHLAIGAIGVAAATAIMYASSLSAFTQRLAASGITLSPAD